MRTSLLAWVVLGGVLAAPPARAQAPVPSPAPPAPAPASPPASLAATPSPAPAPRVFVVALLRKGPAWTAAETPEVRALQEQHLANIGRLAQEGKLVAAGPCGDGDLRGIFVFATDALPEAREWGETDPAVQAGRLRLEPHRFLGTSGIGRNVEAEAAKAGGKHQLVEYQLALVRLGKRYNADEVNENRALFMARNAWLQQLQTAGTLALSGPFLDGGDPAGMLVLRAGSVDAARALLLADPAIKTERFAFDVEPLWLAKGTLD